MANYVGGDTVYATNDIYMTERSGRQTDFMLAEKGERLVVRNGEPLEVSTWRNPLLSFEVSPNQIYPE